ncbi:TPA: ribonuclease HI [Candidatus Woesearchaeota archaeon]|nr:ribonuclease HI [Candidatus Woesearchaeota archaeon]
MPKLYAFILPDGKNGMCHSWADCEKKVKGASGAKYRGFKTSEGAEKWLAEHTRNLSLETPGEGIYFDAGTGRGKGVEVRVTDRDGKNQLLLIQPSKSLTEHGTLLLNGRTNNYGELQGLALAIDAAIHRGMLHVYGDSVLVLDYWSKGQVKIDDKDTMKLAMLVAGKRKRFEKRGGSVGYVPGDVNPADLGFHRVGRKK